MAGADETPAPVVVVAGPTAAGKSETAVAIAERFGGEILNADSMQVYRFLDIGTAKPAATLRARVPHHLYDVVTPDQRYSAGRYANDARQVANDVIARGNLPVLTGGTGLYLRAFLEGVVETPAVDPARRAALERESEEAVEQGDPHRLHRRLTALDPESAARIHPNDVRRTLRALEICESTGRLASELRDAHHFADRPYRDLYLVLDPGRAELDRRIAARSRAMIEGGLLQELRGLLDRGYATTLAPLQAIGYRHLLPVAEGRDTLAHALEEMIRDTRRFARRQRTWFRGVEHAVWVDPRDRDKVLGLVERFCQPADPEQADPEQADPERAEPEPTPP